MSLPNPNKYCSFFLLTLKIELFSSVGVIRRCMISNNSGHSLLPPASSHACITKQCIKFPPNWLYYRKPINIHINLPCVSVKSSLTGLTSTYIVAAHWWCQRMVKSLPALQHSGLTQRAVLTHQTGQKVWLSQFISKIYLKKWQWCYLVETSLTVCLERVSIRQLFLHLVI